MLINWNGKNFRVQVARISRDRAKERYEIRGRNKVIIVESNKPLLENKNLDDWMPTYRVTSGQVHTPGFEKALTDALHKHLTALTSSTYNRRG
ncbi:MAG: hypothetical protein EOO04_18865 [Chitinophagaceae bacterium]|nr:MAG: hypothetical protein EOO04_18865 [Chitinophagaceae bacterium]